MNDIKMRSMHVWNSDREFTTTFITPIGEVKTSVELPSEFVKEINEKAIEAFRLKLAQQKKELIG